MWNLEDTFDCAPDTYSDGMTSNDGESISGEDRSDESSDEFNSDETDYPITSSDVYGMDLYQSEVAQTPLFDGAEVTVLQALVHYFSWFTQHPSMSKEALSNILHIHHHHILPKGNKLPDSYMAAMKVIQPFLVKPIIFDCCPNDCIVFRGDYEALEECPKCDAKRFTPKRLPKKRYSYLPIAPRLARMFESQNIAQILQNHAVRSHDDESTMYDIQDSPRWKNAYSKEGIFLGDSRGIAFSLCTDGVNPFSKNRVVYSMWPIVLTLLNLPRNIRNLFGNLMLVGIFPGNGTKEPGSLNPYLEILVDEMLPLSNQQLYDSYRKAPFMLKVDILLYILDYPGINKVFGTMGSGAYQGCSWCEIEGMSFSCKKFRT